LNILVIMGGPSAEYDVSISSGTEVVTHLSSTGKYAVGALVISRDLEFYFHPYSYELPDVSDFTHPADAPSFRGPFKPFDSAGIWQDCQMAFLALHGDFGEDGVIQGYLETLKIPYNGSGVFSSSLAMNKIATKLMYLQKGIPTPAFETLHKEDSPEVQRRVLKNVGLPCFIKCPQSGSSKLMGRAETEEDFFTLVSELVPQAKEILVEANVTGIEFSCPVLELPHDGPTALLPVEIRPVKGAYFDYEAKYTENACEEIVPASHEQRILQQVQDLAVEAHKCLGCRSISRTDMIYAEGEMYVLETNTLPGLTPNSLLPKSYIASTGKTYSDLLERLIETALITTRAETA